eukprot:15435759-Alexandrium_andersonii.AAC.1
MSESALTLGSLRGKVPRAQSAISPRPVGAAIRPDPQSGPSSMQTCSKPSKLELRGPKSSL